MKDLFGQPINELEIASRKRSHATPSPVGSGPEGETCRTCDHSYYREQRSAKHFWKCDLVKATNGPGTDIKLKWAACRQWTKRETDK